MEGGILFIALLFMSIILGSAMAYVWYLMEMVWRFKK